MATLTTPQSTPTAPHHQQHTIVALVVDQPGVLTRVASLFRRRGYNIVSLSVGPSEQQGLSRMTFVVTGDNDVVEQVTKQLHKLIEVMKVSDVTGLDAVSRELALVKVRTTPDTRAEVVQIVGIFRADIIDVGPSSLVIEVTGDGDKIEALLTLLRPFGVTEVSRTGRVAMVRGLAEARAARKTRSGSQPTASNGAPAPREEESD